MECAKRDAGGASALDDLNGQRAWRGTRHADDFANRMGESLDTSLPVCRDRGWMRWMGGGLVPVLRAGAVRWPHENPNESSREEGQAQGPLSLQNDGAARSLLHSPIRSSNSSESKMQTSSRSYLIPCIARQNSS